MELVKKADVLKMLDDILTDIYEGEGYQHEKWVDKVNDLPEVDAQPVIHCRDCKWWKDSDGTYRRGTGAESICPMNTLIVYEGDGYCYLFEPQESED